MVTIPVQKPKAIILRTAGTNCDFETKAAFELAGAQADRVHINRLIRKEIRLSDYQMLAVPGGFSYGDDIASGKILANEMKNKLGNDLKEFADSGKPVIGICNGFQVLVKMGILPNDGNFIQSATLSSNDSDRFEARWISLMVNRKVTQNCLWTRGLPAVFDLPVAHGEGKYIAKDDKSLHELEHRGQVAFRYCDSKGKPASDYPANPNGSVNAIAGICNPKGNILGLMPHPERFVYRWQHPGRVQSGKEQEAGWGLQLFVNAVSSVK